MTLLQERPARDRPTSEWQFVTPVMAESFLRNNSDNRRVRAVHVSRIAHDMSSGNFAVTHQGIAFDEDGRLVDGQHRLMGITASGEPQLLLVTYGLSRTAKRYMDRGAVRSTSDFVDGPHAIARTSATRYLLAVRASGGRLTIPKLDGCKRIVTDADIHHVLATEPGLAADLEELAPLASRAATQVPVGPSGLLAAAVSFPAISEAALESMASGVGLRAGDPVLTFRNYSGRRWSYATAVFAAFKVLRAVEEGRAISLLKVLPTEELLITPR